MAYGESNDHLLDDVTCPVFSILLLFCLKLLRKTANIIEKTQFITLLTAIVHCFTHRKQQKIKNDKGYITKQHVDILTRCSIGFND